MGNFASRVEAKFQFCQIFIFQNFIQIVRFRPNLHVSSISIEVEPLISNLGFYTPSLTLWQGRGGAERPPRDNQRLPDLGFEGVKVVFEMQYQAAWKAMGGSHSYTQFFL